MAGQTDVKQLLLQVDASVELLRRNLTAGQARVDQFTADTTRRLDAADRRFGEFGRPLAGMNASIAGARREIATLSSSVEQTESRIRASAGGIKAALLASTAGVAAAFSANQIKEYADGYTRYTNQLKVAGLEGANLAKTQEQLYGIAQRYGVQLESVGTLYSRASQAGTALGASQADLIKFTDGVGAALKVQGGSAESAQGALLQLSQLLASGTVHAEEFNSVNEGARPILQAVANGIDKYKGSVAALRADVLAGSLTSQQFFQGFLAGSSKLEAQAAKSNLTIGASFTILNNALGKYIGETDAGLSATARISGAIVALADNLDVVAPALAIVGASFATRFVAGPIAAVAAEVLLLTKALDGERLVLIGGKVAQAQKAEATAATAAAEVAAIEATIAARRADQAVLLEQIVAERALAEERRAAAVNYAAQNVSGGNRTVLLAAQRKAENDAAFATDRLTVARERLVVVDGELAVAEGALGAAQVRSAAATTAAAEATAAATLASRAGAAASKLFASTLTLIGGSTAGGAAVLVIGALIGAMIAYNNYSTTLEQRNQATAKSMVEAAAASKKLNADLAAVAASGAGAASGIAQAGGAASTATGQMRTFAGAVGEAAEKLRGLAEARRKEEISNFTHQSAEAEHQANLAEQRINARKRNKVANRGFESQADASANADDAAIVVQFRSIQGSAYRAAQAAARRPLESRIRESDRAGGRDVEGELARVTRDLVVARERGIKATVDSLEAQKFELTQYKDYRKKGLSPEAAQAAATNDAASFRNASSGAQGDREARAGRQSARRAGTQAAAASRREAAAVRDAAADERAYSAAERQANNDIAAARADLTNSARERAQIEKERIESERLNRNNEIEQQAKQGGLGAGDVAKRRVLELQRLNDQRAQLETEVVDARERQRVADEALTIAQADRGSQSELLSKQADLVSTAAQRRDLELRILAIQYDEERARLDGVIASRDTTEAEKEVARRRRAALTQLQAADTEKVERQNEGPLDQYRRRLRESTGDLNTALQGVAVDGLEEVQNGLLGLVNSTESVSSAFKKMAQSIIADLARIAIQKAVVKAIGGSFFGLSTGGKIEGKATGGRISGPGTGTSDSILALVDGKRPLMVSNGESIVTAEATARWWPVIEAMNKGTLGRFATGGVVGQTPGTSLNLPPAPRIAGVAAAGAGGTLSVRVTLSDDLHATIDNRAAGVAVQVVKATAPEIVSTARTATLASIGQPTL